MPVNGATNGVGSVQQNTNTQSIQQQPKKGHWGKREVRSFSPSTVFIANTPKSTAEAPKKLPDFNITAKDSKVYCQKTDDGLYYTFNPGKGKKASKRFLKQQAGILVEKGYSNEEANRFIKELSKTTGKHKAVIKDAVAKKEFADSDRQKLAQWAESQLIQKGYSPEDARQQAYDLVKKRRTGSEWVQNQIRYTPQTPAKKATNLLEAKGFSPEESRQIFDDLMQQSKGDFKKVFMGIEARTPENEAKETLKSKASDRDLPRN